MSDTSTKGPLAMTTEDDIASLIERVKAATEGDNDLDRDVAIVLGWTPPAMGLPYWHDDEGNHWTALPDWSTSLDDALALVERLKPGFDYILEHTNGGLTISCMLGTADPDKRWFGETPPLALLAALLTSLKENHP